MQPDIVALVTQFGMAGLVAWMWLTERRAAVTREQQLTQAHEEVIEARTHLDTLLRTLNDNTRAIASLEAGQRTLHALLERITEQRSQS